MALGIETFAILASGPSMNPETVSAVRAAGVTAIVVNDTYRLMPDAYALFAADWAWWNRHPEAMGFQGLKLTSEENVPAPVWFIKPRGPKAGGNSAMHAAHYAQDVGAARILLFGVDLNEDKLTHWHGQHGEGLHNPTAATFKRARAAWATYAAETDRPEIINCNPDSGLDCFPKMTAGEALCLAS